jgi:ABC-type transport system involved in cytochrome c biogenesis permease subunit
VNPDVVMVWAGIGCYAVSSVLALVSLLHPANRGARLSLALMGAGAACLLAVLLHRVVGDGVMPTLTRFEAFSCYAVGVTAAYLVLMAVRPVPGLSSLIVPYLTAVLACGLPGVCLRAGPPPPLQGVWVWLHVLTAFAGYAVFSLASVLAAAYLVQDHNMKQKRFGLVWERLPTLETLDHLMGLQVGFGFALFTGATLLGAMLAHQSGWGGEWFTDPKVGAAAVTWILFAVLVHMRASANRHGKRMALVTIAGLLCVLFTFVGVHLVADSVHRFIQIASHP